jgi:hypothetical protein
MDVGGVKIVLNRWFGEKDRKLYAEKFPILQCFKLDGGWL